jgi:hypothetical protein
MEVYRHSPPVKQKRTMASCSRPKDVKKDRTEPIANARVGVKRNFATVNSSTTFGLKPLSAEVPCQADGNDPVCDLPHGGRAVSLRAEVMVDRGPFGVARSPLKVASSEAPAVVNSRFVRS